MSLKPFTFSNLIGTIYKTGNIVFSKDGSLLFSPVGNKVTVYNLKSHTTHTLPFQSSHNCTCLALSPNNVILLCGNEVGEILTVSLVSKTILHVVKMGNHVKSIKFSPDGLYFSAATASLVRVYRTPSPKACYNPSHVVKTLQSSSISEFSSLMWSNDSRMLACIEGSVIRLLPLTAFYGFERPITLSAHRDFIVECFFSTSNYSLYSVSRNGQLNVWSSTVSTLVEKSDHDRSDEKISTATLSFKKENVFFYSSDENFGKGTSITSATFDRRNNIITVGCNDGKFFMHDLPQFNCLQSLSVCQDPITTLSMSPNADWVAFGSSKLGKIVVLEWLKQFVVMDQQSHFNSIETFDYSPDSRYIVTGGQDGKVKIWSVADGFCFMTFSDHTSSISGVVFTQNGRAVVSASLDGTVRAFDMSRYRNFRTFTAHRLVQFSCVAVDSGKEFVAAGGKDTFDIYLWSLKTGKLLEVFGGHEAPVSCVSFSPTIGSTALVSSSWDKTVRMWECIDKSGDKETLQLHVEATTLTFRPDGQQVSVATLDGSITFFSCPGLAQMGSIDGRNHLGSGRSDTDLVTAQKSLAAKCFSTLSYSPDSELLLAAGKSKMICLYHVENQILLMRYEITMNKSIDAVSVKTIHLLYTTMQEEFIHRRNISDFGNMSIVEERSETGDQLSLPGVKSGDMASRAFKPEVRVSCVKFSATGNLFTAATTEGLLTYSTESSKIFDPIGDISGITPSSIGNLVRDKRLLEALIQALKLNMKSFIRYAVESFPSSDVVGACKGLSYSETKQLLQFLSYEFGKTVHIEYYLDWLDAIFRFNLERILGDLSTRTCLNLLNKNLTLRNNVLTKVVNSNKYTIQYILKTGENIFSHAKKEVGDEENNDGLSMLEDAADMLMRSIEVSEDSEDDDSESFEEDSSTANSNAPLKKARLV